MDIFDESDLGKKKKKIGAEAKTANKIGQKRMFYKSDEMIVRMHLFCAERLWNDPEVPKCSHDKGCESALVLPVISHLEKNMLDRPWFQFRPFYWSPIFVCPHLGSHYETTLQESTGLSI